MQENESGRVAFQKSAIAGVVSRQADYKAAAKALIQACKVAYPVGQRVRVQFWEYSITGKVIGHSDSWWHRPGSMTMKSEANGRLRGFNFENKIEILEEERPPRRLE